MNTRTLTRSLSCCAGSMLGLLIASSAHGQPLTVTASLLAGEEQVGHVRDVSVVARKWTSSTRFQFDLSLGGDDEKAATLHGTVDLGQGDSIVKGRVCADVPLAEVEKSGDDFALVMLAGTETELVSRSPRGIVIRVPAPVPTEPGDERLLPASALCRGSDGSGGSGGRKPNYLDCEPFEFFPRPDEESEPFQVHAARSIAVKEGKDGWHRVSFDDFHGFRWLGFTQQAPKCTEPPAATEGLSSRGTLFGHNPPPCRNARLPRGAVLRAADRKTALLTVRRDFEARICTTEQAFEWEIELPAGSGEVFPRGFFDGSPLPPLGSADGK